MASYSAIPLQHLNTGNFHEETHYSRGGVDTEPKNPGKISSQRVSGGSYDTKPLRGQKSPRHAGYGRLASAWWQEIVSFLFAATFFVAIAIILAKYNGQEQPDWKYSLNLSTLVAILSTLLRASLVVVVEESEYKVSQPVSTRSLTSCSVVSQLKWLWYKTTRVRIKATGVLLRN